MCSTSDNSEYEISPSAPSKLPPLRSGNFSYSRNVICNAWGARKKDKEAR